MPFTPASRITADDRQLLREMIYRTIIQEEKISVPNSEDRSVLISFYLPHQVHVPAWPLQRPFGHICRASLRFATGGKKVGLLANSVTRQARTMIKLTFRIGTTLMYISHTQGCLSRMRIPFIVLLAGIPHYLSLIHI